MLSDFVRKHRDEIIARCRTRVAARMAPAATRTELEHGIPLFLCELERTLVCELGHAHGDATAAVQHGSNLRRSGFTVAQVVHDYGDVCQTITELAIGYSVPISTEEFRALTNCVDHAIAESVTEYERQHENELIAEDARRANKHLGFIAHELRNTLSSALLAFDVLRAGSVGIHGSTGDVLGRSLVALRDLVDRSLTEVRLTAGTARPEKILVARFIEDMEISALLSAKERRLKLTVSEVDPTLTLETDRQILSSVVSNLLQNAFKYTRPHSHVWLHIQATADRVLFSIEDQCGGLPPGKAEQLFEPFVQPSADRSGLGFGLAICVRAVTALRGAISVRNQNNGCVFTVDLPRSGLTSAPV
jgi:signal transduction histidine kinase